MTRRFLIVLILATTCSMSGFAANNSTLPPAASREIDFVRDIQPIFRMRCYSCHDGAKQRGGFRLDLKSAALKGGESYSPVIVPGKSADSPLVRFVAGLEEGLLMPPEGERLSAEQIGLLRAWIDQGAKWPDEASAKEEVHWSFRPVSRPELPDVARENVAWLRNPVDAFVAATLVPSPSSSGERARVRGPSGENTPSNNNGLHSASSRLVAESPTDGPPHPSPLPTRAGGEGTVRKIAPSPEADRMTLIRRLNFDLLGLPPTPEEVAEFVADARPDAYERLVDRLLASPHFGERWARHWLDIVRFAESDGFETNQPRPNAWPYRDYVIRAFNEDKPFEQFVTEQLAGDGLGVDEATGFIVGGAWDRVKSPDPGLTAQQRADELHDMVSTTGSAFLGLTVGCARCHNHKFDPISQVDYYSLKAVFAGVQHGERALKPADFDQREPQIARAKTELAEVERALRAFEPLASTATTLLLDDDTPESKTPDAPSVSLLVPRIGLEPHRAGAARGQTSDPGDARRLPNLGRNYSYWKNVAGKDVFAWNLRVNGRFQAWLSWGCGWHTHATDARYVLDLDGDLNTKDDQREIARVDQRRFADGTGGDEKQPLWSGFFPAGEYDFTTNTRVILRGGETDAYITADLLCLQRTKDEGPRAALPNLRPSVHRKTNVERFAPLTARFVRFVVEQTNNGSQPCLDEVEIFSTESTPRNVAREAKVTSSSNLPGHEIHQLKHVHDGRYGNGASWISHEAGRGWVQFEFAEPVEIDRVLWSRDRPENGQYTDRIPTKYRIEAGQSPDAMIVVASSDDRLPIERNLTTLVTRIGLSEQEQVEANQLAERQTVLSETLRRLTALPQVYAGRFVAPEPTNRLHRGDPLQPKEPIAPASLASFGPTWTLPLDAPETSRRQQLAKWITDPQHPLTSRVLVNRLWHFHFGQGLVTTPSDFGRNGALPSHPELLDWLASECRGGDMEKGRHGEIPTVSESSLPGSSSPPLPLSPKSLHRLIITSATYRQSSAARADAMLADAGTRLLWRYPPRRLEAEPLRDAILAVCGNFDDRMGGPGFDLFEPNTNYVKVYNSKKEFGPADWRRMVYQSKPRMQLDDTFGQFDCPDAGQITPKRTSSITALQALNLLNSRFIVQQSSLFASRLEREAGPDTNAQVHRAYSLTFLRPPTDDEQSVAVEFAKTHGLPALCRALLNANEFLFVF